MSGMLVLSFIVIIIITRREYLEGILTLPGNLPMPHFSPQSQPGPHIWVIHNTAGQANMMNTMIQSWVHWHCKEISTLHQVPRVTTCDSPSDLPTTSDPAAACNRLAHQCLDPMTQWPTDDPMTYWPRNFFTESHWVAFYPPEDIWPPLVCWVLTQWHIEPVAI